MVGSSNYLPPHFHLMCLRETSLWSHSSPPLCRSRFTRQRRKRCTITGKTESRRRFGAYPHARKVRFTPSASPPASYKGVGNMYKKTDAVLVSFVAWFAACGSQRMESIWQRGVIGRRRYMIRRRARRLGESFCCFVVTALVRQPLLAPQRMMANGN